MCCGPAQVQRTAPAWLITSEEPAPSSVLVSPASPLPHVLDLTTDLTCRSMSYLFSPLLHSSLGGLGDGLERHLPTPSPSPSQTSVIPSLFFLKGYGRCR